MESRCSLEILIQTSENLKCKKGLFQFVEASGSGWRTSSDKLELKCFWCQAAVKEGEREKVIRQDKALVVHRRLWPFFQEKRFWPRGYSGPELLLQTLNNSLTSDLRMRFRMKCLSLNTSGFIPARRLGAKTYLVQKYQRSRSIKTPQKYRNHRFYTHMETNTTHLWPLLIIRVLNLSIKPDVNPAAPVWFTGAKPEESWVN